MAHITTIARKRSPRVPALKYTPLNTGSASIPRNMSNDLTYEYQLLKRAPIGVPMTASTVVARYMSVEATMAPRRMRRSLLHELLWRNEE